MVSLAPERPLLIEADGEVLGYTPATGKWQTARMPLHSPFYDREWIAVLPGPAHWPAIRAYASTSSTLTDSLAAAPVAVAVPVGEPVFVGVNVNVGVGVFVGVAGVNWVAVGVEVSG